MRLDFDKSVPLIEQRLRIADAKQPGRKHQKRKGVKAKERSKASNKRSIALKAQQARKLKSAISEYWRGEREEFPIESKT